MTKVEFIMDKYSLTHNLYNLLVKNDIDGLDLPAAPDLDQAYINAANIISELELNIGEASKSDYFICSRARFTYLTSLAIAHLSKGDHILDVGNAPGYLGVAMHNAGFKVDGINLSDEWNSTYPEPHWLNLLNVKSIDVERDQLPYENDSLDAILFTEVLEHIAITDPQKIVLEFRRVLRPGGRVIFSTPNVCNISNIIALATGVNIFWAPNIFYGSTDRHNREYTPAEVRSLFESNGFSIEHFFGINDHANWRSGTAEYIYNLLDNKAVTHALLRNTIMGTFKAEK